MGGGGCCQISTKLEVSEGTMAGGRGTHPLHQAGKMN